jgi:formylglycine-generating enzyme required for sulfatase activity
MRAVVTTRLIGTCLRAVCFTALAAAGLLSKGSRGEEPGKVEPVDCGDGLVIPFCYCPPGTFLPLNERGEPGSEVTLKDFWVSQSEVSQEQYKVVMRAGMLDEIAKRLPPVIVGMHFKQGGGKFEVYSVRIGEGVEFCRALTARVSKDSKARGLVQDLFRLPTYQEWQYACRTGRPDVLHYSGWPAVPMGTNAFGEANARQAWTTEWKAMGRKPEDFRGSQDDLVAIFAHLKARNDAKNPNAKRLLAIVMKEGLGLDYAFEDYLGDLQAVDGEVACNSAGKLRKIPPDRAYKLNSWNVRHMHGNVAEWTLDADPATVDGVWTLLSGEADRPAQKSPEPALDGLRFLIAGGGFDHSGNWTQWDFFTSWGARGCTYPEVNQTTTDLKPGLRIVRVRGIAPDWLLHVREIAMRQPIEPGTINELIDGQKKVLDYSAGTNKDTNRSLTDFYIALAHYRLNDTKAATVRFRSFQNLGEARGQRGRYFSLLGKLLERDDPKPPI